MGYHDNKKNRKNDFDHIRHKEAYDRTEDRRSWEEEIEEEELEEEDEN